MCIKGASTPIEDRLSDLNSSIDSRLDKCALLKPSSFPNFVCIFKTPQPPSIIPTVNMKSSGKVFTSIENIRKMEGKEKDKAIEIETKGRKFREEKKKVTSKSKKRRIFPLK